MDHEPEYWPGPAGMMRTTILIIVLLVVVWLSFLIFSPFFLAFATAAPIALLLFPTQERLAAGMGGRRRSLAAMLLVIWIALLVAIPLAAVLSLVGSQAVTFFSWVGPQLEPDRVQHFLRVTLPQRVPWFGAAWTRSSPTSHRPCRTCSASSRRGFSSSFRGSRPGWAPSRSSCSSSSSSFSSCSGTAAPFCPCCAPCRRSRPSRRRG